jgi:hypothetical protein
VRFLRHGRSAARHPRELRGTSGEVEFEVVIDSAGTAEPGSFRALKATHPAFIPGAEYNVVTSRYAPAELDGRKVRQLLRQTIVFSSSSRPGER